MKWIVLAGLGASAAGLVLLVIISWERFPDDALLWCVSSGPRWLQVRAALVLAHRAEPSLIHMEASEPDARGPASSDASETLVIDSIHHDHGPWSGEDFDSGIAPPVNTEVAAVDPRARMVVLGAGAKQRVQVGYCFTLYRGDHFVGKAKVVRLFEDLAGAKIIYVTDNDEVRVGDKAATQL
jgi:hypothetical protein